jgi:TonB family protein
MWILLAGALAATAPAPCPADAPSQLSSNPDWAVKPGGDAVWWSYPPNAAAALVESRVQITCEISVEGAAENCKVDNEEKPGLGFGEAALSLTADMKFKPKMTCGVAERGEVSIPLNFKLPADPDAPFTGPPPSPEAIALARRLVADLGLMDMVDQQPNEELTRAMFGPEGLSSTAEQRRAYYESVQESWALVRQKIEAALVASYARRMTRLELADAVAFYESPLGRKLVAQDRVARMDTTYAMDALAPQMQRDFKARLCAKTHSCGGKTPR